jgi:hypothetical protein
MASCKAPCPTQPSLTATWAVGPFAHRVAVCSCSGLPLQRKQCSHRCSLCAELHPPMVANVQVPVNQVSRGAPANAEAPHVRARVVRRSHLEFQLKLTVPKVIPVDRLVVFDGPELSPFRGRQTWKVHEDAAPGGEVTVLLSTAAFWRDWNPDAEAEERTREERKTNDTVAAGGEEERTEKDKKCEYCSSWGEGVCDLDPLRDNLVIGDSVRIFGLDGEHGEFLNDTLGRCSGEATADRLWPITTAAGVEILLMRDNLVRIASLPPLSLRSKMQICELNLAGELMGWFNRREMGRDGPAMCQGCKTTTGPFMRCSQCRTARFCGQACMKSSWKKHKLVCKLWKRWNEVCDPFVAKSLLHIMNHGPAPHCFYARAFLIIRQVIQHSMGEDGRRMSIGMHI